MMDDSLVLVRDVPWTLDVSSLARRLHVKPGSRHFTEFEALCADALAAGKPAGMARLLPVEAWDESGAVIGGQRFESRVLSVNLRERNRVFGYVATCGQELNAWAESLDDLLLQYEAEAIKELALGAGTVALKKAVEAQYQPGKTSTMAPGSLADWPIAEQAPLFRALGDTSALVGVELGETMLMTPNKSVSGIRFAVEEDFFSCLLCSREGCPHRRMAYQPELYQERYAGAVRSNGV